MFLGTVAERGHAAWNTTLISALRRRWQPVGDEGLSSQILLSRYCNAFLPATAILCGRRSDRVRRRSDLAIPVPPGPSMGGAWFRGRVRVAASYERALTDQYRYPRSTILRKGSVHESKSFLAYLPRAGALSPIRPTTNSRRNAALGRSISQRLAACCG